ncbi:MAG: peptidoglycan-associated lipoprotein Pal [Candidatus Omnitrophica bacterium]|nr:peptidoglycan-associated lipoprotein Pal [Candidatus Omnitrophota bacterium]MCA9416479.1 peptidoglycan-associated lipoprotein Pal [Candidatus Omnitrophota bacterium]MCA9430143.1 peptidoglycan-associated lipoprotein Pal [Candidatus Omnitrophota bacterium]MCA9435322.1 peptidoglycan-associated lipoprotein Pal [Candidatus Omnitrophota bacterium]MCA9445921.1 peptidoglycan-associated lipoprotein Pal [Candidatus Omnitrophota bacterium]
MAMGGPVGGGSGMGSGSGYGNAGGDGWNQGAGGDQYGGFGAGDSDKTRLSGEPKFMLDTVYFDYDQSNLKPNEVMTLERNLAWVQQNPGSKIRIEGHCDERGTEEYNLALGERRAESVRQWLISRGVPASNIDTVTKGELEPAVPGHSEAAWAKNRRAEFLILE